MNAAPPPKLSPPGKRASIALAVAVHLVLAAFLVYGVRWQTKAPAAVEVELVKATPAPTPVPPPPPVPPPEPEPKPEPKPEPPPPPPKTPDIAVKEKPKPKPPKEAPRPKFDPSELLKQEDEALDKRRAAETAAQEAAQRRQAETAAARGKAVADYSERIKAKIRSNIVLPPGLKGNPTARAEVVQIPGGEIISVRIARPSGHSGYDAAVERAILKSSPLPKPLDPALFERRLDLTFCPQEPCQ